MSDKLIRLIAHFFPNEDIHCAKHYEDDNSLQWQWIECKLYYYTIIKLLQLIYINLFKFIIIILYFKTIVNVVIIKKTLMKIGKRLRFV